MGGHHPRLERGRSAVFEFDFDLLAFEFEGR